MTARLCRAPSTPPHLAARQWAVGCAVLGLAVFGARGAAAEDAAAPADAPSAEVATAPNDQALQNAPPPARQVGVEGEFRCPGDDPGFWMDWKEAGWAGYGETWDIDTCGQGVPIYAEGANNRWPDMRPQLANGEAKLTPLMSEAEIRYYTNVLPYMAGAVLGLAFLIAWGLTFLDKFKKRTVRLVACAECGTKTPIEKVEGGVFCPSCGAAVAYADGSAPTSSSADA